MHQLILLLSREKMPDNIEQIDQLLKNIIGDSEIEHINMKRLTAPGENYGSLMLSLEIFVKNYDTGMKTKLEMVAKKIPPTELFQKIFNIQVIFKKEVGFYKTIVPTLKSFCHEMGVENILNCFADFYGARFNLQCDDNVVDDNAILVLENLAAIGFSNINRFTGFDMNCTKLILKDLAEFHAAALALKLKRPETFNNKLKKYCINYIFPYDILKNYRDVTRMVLRENQNCADLIERVSLLGEQKRPAAREPWATLIHCDLWTNNTMQKYRDGEAIANKFVDFQMFSYGSAASDVFFFLWSSVSRSVLEQFLDDLIQFYYNYFSRIFKAFDCGKDPPTFECFMEDMRLEAVYEFGHAIVFSTLVVNGKKRSTEMVGIPDQEEFYSNVPLEAKKRAWFMLEECAKRGWI